MHIHAENEVPVDRLRNTEVYANVFNALPGAKVEFRIGKSGEWKVMEVATERDPLYMAMHDRELALGGDAHSGNQVWVTRILNISGKQPFRKILSLEPTPSM